MLTTRYHLDEAHLKHYDARLKSWASSQPVKTLPSSLYPWTQTDKAGAVTCWPVGGTPLKPSVDFLFTEVPPASGDKGPENPSTITGVESVTVGNVLNLYRLPSGYSVTRSGVTCTVDNDGVITLNGTCTAQDSFTAYKTNLPLGKVVFPSGTTLYMKMVELGGSCTLNDTLGVKMQMSCPRTNGASWYPGVGPTLSEASDSSSVSFKILSSAVVIYSGAVYNNYRIKAQFNINKTVQTVENQIENIYTLPLGNTYYGGTLDVASGVMTVTHTSLLLNGSTIFSNSGFSEGTDTYALRLYPSSARSTGLPSAADIACDRLSATPGVIGSSATPGFYFGANSANVMLLVSKTDIGVSDDATKATVQTAVNAWFATYPTTLVYPVASPFVVQLTPQQIKALAQKDKYTPRLNTVYTDASAVQVGYVKSPIREEYELTQAIVAQGGNI